VSAAAGGPPSRRRRAQVCGRWKLARLIARWVLRPANVSLGPGAIRLVRSPSRSSATMRCGSCVWRADHSELRGVPRSIRRATQLQAFLESHEGAFILRGGVRHPGGYDNLTSAVRKNPGRDSRRGDDAVPRFRLPLVNSTARFVPPCDMATMNAASKVRRASGLITGAAPRRGPTALNAQLLAGCRATKRA